MRKLLLLSTLMFTAWISGCSQGGREQGTAVGGSCEGCEALFEYGSKKLSSIDTLPDFKDAGPRMILSGTIFLRDGKTPARNVILYVYHTDQKGVYPTKGDEKGWAKRHGYLRGWIKTDASGKYTFYTLRPAHYPGRDAPQHIHATVKEPDRDAYWIDEYLFDDDPVLTANDRAQCRNRTGSGILKTQTKNGIIYATRDIVLGLNIPNY